MVGTEVFLYVAAAFAIPGLLLVLHNRQVEKAVTKTEEFWIKQHSTLDKRLEEAEAENEQLRAELEALKRNGS